MRVLTQNLFRINNLSNLDFSFRLVEFDLAPMAGQQGFYNKQLKKIAQKVSSLIGGPAVLIKWQGKAHVAIPADCSIPETKIDVVAVTVTVRMVEGVNRLDSSKIGSENVELIEKFLDFEIRRQLSSNRHLWKLSSNHFYHKVPTHPQDQALVDVYTGFVFKLVMLSDGNLYICLDLATKYIERAYLSAQINLRNAQQLSQRFRGRQVLYENGDQWYQAEIVAFGGSIDQHEFPFEGQTQNVFQYVNAKFAASRSGQAPAVDRNDVTLLYKYPGRTMTPHSGAVSMAKIIYDTNDPEAKTLHRQSIKDPSRRFEAIGSNMGKYFARLTFYGEPLRISMKPLQEKVQHFSMPELRFNNKVTLKIGPKSDKGSAQLRDFSTLRRQNIVDHGILNKTRFDEQFLVVPDYMKRELVEAFKRNAEAQLKKLAPGFTTFKIITYRVASGQSAIAQIQQIERELARQNALAGFALFVLPDLKYESKRQVRNFHDCLKNKFYPSLKIQCASSLKVSAFFKSYPDPNSPWGNEYRVPEEKKSRFRSYMFYLAMEHLIVNRKWPYSLEEDPNYDIYIGIDVHDRHAGFTFFFKRGEQIFFFPEEVPRKNRSQRAEKLQASLLVQVIYEKLKRYIPTYSPNPNGIVIIRDGRSFGEEDKALESVVNLLANDGLVNKEYLKYGLVDLHKHSAIPLRMASETNGFNKLENPIAGTYRLIGANAGFLFNTGYPFSNPGSAKPLHLSLKSGNVDFIKVMQDIFGQTMLAFSAPDKPNSLPVTIKLIDTLLEPLSGALTVGEDDQEYEVAELTES